jgi:hypothetical protein
MFEALDFLEVDALPNDLVSNKGVMMYLRLQDGVNAPGMYYTDGTEWNLFLRAKNPNFLGTMRGPRYGEVVQTVTASAGSTTIDLSLGSYIVLTLNVASTITFTNIPATGTAAGFTLEVIYNGNVLSFAQTIKWPTKTVPTQTAAGSDVFALYSRNGTSFIGAQAMKDIG